MASKRKASDTPAPPASSAQQKDSKVIHFTARNPPWSYLKLQLYGFSSIFLSVYPYHVSRTITLKTHE